MERKKRNKKKFGWNKGKCNRCSEPTAQRSNGYFKQYCNEHESAERKLRRYNLTWEELDALMETDFCECCGELMEGSNKCIDHDHYTKKIRGVICSRCNRALGFSGDTVEGVHKLLIYLNKHYG